MHDQPVESPSSPPTAQGAAWMGSSLRPNLGSSLRLGANRLLWANRPLCLRRRVPRRPYQQQRLRQRPRLHVRAGVRLKLGRGPCPGGLGLGLRPRLTLCLCLCLRLRLRLHMRCRHLRRYPAEPRPRMPPCPRLRLLLHRQASLAARRSPGPSARLTGKATRSRARRVRRAGRKMLRFCAVLAWMNKPGGVYAHPISIRNDAKKGGTRGRLGPPSSGAHQKAPSGA